MKTKFITSLIVLALLFSCKKEVNSTDSEVKVEEVSKDFKVTLDVNVKKDDSFHLFYTEDGTSNFTEESSVWVEFKGKDESQEVVFNLPKNTIPTQLRLDFGVNKDQEDIILNNFKMEYLGKSYEAPSAKFFTIFIPNDLVCKVDVASATIKPIKEKDKQYFGPSFYPLETLSKEIEKLIK